MKRQYLLEWIIITLVGLCYFGFIAPTVQDAGYEADGLDLSWLRQIVLDEDVRPIGLEHERLVGTILPVQIGLEHYGHIPFWNPYLGNGTPILNNGFNYLFNPFHSLPVLALGGVQGSKAATVIALLLAGYHAWVLGWAVGMGAVARVSTALLYLLSGGIVAKFGAGHFQLACSLAWPPLVLAGWWRCLHGQSRFAPVGFGLAFALLLFAGNIYYALHTLLCCGVIGGLHVMERQAGRWRWQWGRMRRMGWALALAFGLSALQFFPLWLTRDYVIHDGQLFNADGTLERHYDLQQALINLVWPWSDWYGLQKEDLSGVIGAVDYHYIGLGVFVVMGAAGGVALVWRRQAGAWLREQGGRKRLIVACIGLALVMMIWAGGEFPPLVWLYTHVPLLREFRFVGRALAVGALCWIVVGGLAVDFLWQSGRSIFRTEALFDRQEQRRLLRVILLALLAWGYLLIYSVSPVTTRLPMVLRDVSMWELLDRLRFTTVENAAAGLLLMAGVLLAVDGVVLVVVRSIRRAAGGVWRPIMTHVWRLALLGGLALMVFDLMVSNSPALEYGLIAGDSQAVYQSLHRLDAETPYPSVSQPFSPRSFDAYTAEVRNWFLNEGWRPGAIPGILSEGKMLPDLPRWAVAYLDENGISYDERVNAFIEDAGYERVGCYTTLETTDLQIDCNEPLANGIDLYEQPSVLPYAFLVSAEALRQVPDTLRAGVVTPVEVLAHEQDSITLRAKLDSPIPHYLVVKENNFPGWAGSIDGVTSQIFTTQTGYANGQQMGLVTIPALPGEHVYRLQFTPPGLLVGGGISGLSVVVAVVYLLWKKKSPSLVEGDGLN